MSLSDEVKRDLELARQKSLLYEGNFYLSQLYAALSESEKPPKELDPVATALINLVNKLDELNTGDFRDNEQKMIEIIKSIQSSYNILAKETKSGGVFYNCKQAVLGLGGIVVGSITAVLGASAGLVGGFFNALKHGRVPFREMATGFATGLLIGSMIGYRVPFKIQNKEQRKITNLVRRISDSMESVSTLSKKSEYEAEEQRVKEEFFTLLDGSIDENAFNKFIAEPQEYAVLASRAAFIDPRFRGSTGHHSFIKFHINGKINKCLELGASSDEDTKFSQMDIRKVESGKTLIKMRLAHRILQKEYKLSLTNPKLLLWRYKPGINDCNSYADKILEVAGEPPSSFLRFTKEDSGLGRLVGYILRALSPTTKVVDDQKKLVVRDDEQGYDVACFGEVKDVETMKLYKEKYQKSISQQETNGADSFNPTKS